MEISICGLRGSDPPDRSFLVIILHWRAPVVCAGWSAMRSFLSATTAARRYLAFDYLSVQQHGLPVFPSSVFWWLFSTSMKAATSRPSTGQGWCLQPQSSSSAHPSISRICSMQFYAPLLRALSWSGFGAGYYGSFAEAATLYPFCS